MRFKPGHRVEPFDDTSRKRAAARRKQERERLAVPLLADLVAEEQPSIDDVMTDRAARWHKSQLDYRARRAQDWRRARRKLASYSSNERAALLAYWNRCIWPGDPSYLLMMLNMFDTGRLDLDEQPGPRTWTND